MKKIFLDLSFIKKRKVTGIQRFALSFVENLKFKNNIYYILVPKNLKLDLKKSNVKILYCTNNVYINIFIANLYLFFLKVDYFFIFGFPLYFFKKNLKYIRILHDDTIFSRRSYFHSFKNDFILFFFEKFWIKRYFKIITVSNYSKNKIKKYFKEKNILVLYNCLSSKLLRYKKKINLNNKFKKQILLCVGTINERKNYEFALNIHDRLFKFFDKFKLIIVGKYGYNYNKFNHVLKKTKNKSSIKILNNTSDKKLSNLYKSASILIVPSKEEGFCIPFIEAQFFKTPVIANNLGIFQEIGNESFIPLKLNLKVWTEEIIDIFSNKKKYFKLCEKSHKNSIRYLFNNPDKIVDEICKS